MSLLLITNAAVPTDPHMQEKRMISDPINGITNDGLTSDNTDNA